jgi:hypothetical protein
MDPDHGNITQEEYDHRYGPDLTEEDHMREEAMDIAHWQMYGEPRPAY